MSPADLVVWGWAAGLALFGLGLPAALLIIWVHAATHRARVVAQRSLKSLEVKGLIPPVR